MFKFITYQPLYPMIPHWQTINRSLAKQSEPNILHCNGLSFLNIIVECFQVEEIAPTCKPKALITTLANLVFDFYIYFGKVRTMNQQKTKKPSLAVQITNFGFNGFFFGSKREVF